LFDWICIKDEVEDIKFGIVLKNRSFPKGEGDGGWGLLNRITERTRVPFDKLRVNLQQKLKSSNKVGLIK